MWNRPHGDSTSTTREIIKREVREIFMNEEEKQAAIEQAKAEAIAASQAQIEEIRNSLNAVTEELKSERQKKQEAEGERDALKAKLGKPGDDDVETKVRTILTQHEQNRAEDVRKNSIKKFKDTHKEFHPDNDPGGLKYAAFEKKLARINTQGLTSEEEFMEAFGDALTILNRQPDPSAPHRTPYDSTTIHNPSPKSADTSGLASLEKKLIESLGWDEERYLKIKKSKPTYVASLLKNFNPEV